ncbi:centromere protein U isoform X2 [Pempheris klunzingeri]|uniref:centromere protein U isoform X2 n=1 Tax=Pempheris klunzingeri TaxID=3127111 RepID=UPI00398054DF
MSAKRGRGAKVLKVPQDGGQKGSSFDNTDTPDLSAIDKAGFLEGLQLHCGNPMHSTAIEEDLDVSEEGQKTKGRKGIPQTLKPTVKQRAAAVKRKKMEEEEEEQKKNTKRGMRGGGGKVGAGSKKEGETEKKKGAPQGERVELDGDRRASDPNAILQKHNRPTPTASSLKQLVGKKPAKRRSAGQASAARPVKNQQMKKNKKTKSESGSGKSSDPQSQEESDGGSGQQRRRKVLSSDEEAPSPKKAKVSSLGRSRKSSSDRSKSRKSSSGSASAEPGKADTDKRRGSGSGRGSGRQGGTELEVVLDTFLDFCDQYRESVESKAVRQSIDSFSSNVKEQLLEKISSSKELWALKRENAKVGSLIRKKTQRLLDAKHELMRAERQAWLLQKEKDGLQLRLADLRRGQAFLHDFRELSTQYQDYRHKHPREKETYGESSLPALLLEAKHIQTAEHQLRGINN